MRSLTPREAASREVNGEWLAVSGGPIGLLAAIYGQPTREAALKAVAGVGLPEGELTTRAAVACARYLAAGVPMPALPLDLSGLPPFTAAVLSAVSRIPHGETRTYGEIAAEAGRPRAARAVGQVMARNPLAPFVPCHRVVGRRGLVGFRGGSEGLPVKRAMLEREGAQLPFRLDA